MGTDLTKSPTQLLIDLINRVNHTVFVTANLSFSPPSVYTDAAKPFFNTSIDVSGASGTRFVGPQTMYYRRLDLEDTFENRSTNFEFLPGTASVTTEQLVAAINNRFGFALHATDFVNQTWTLEPDTPEAAVLTAHEESKLFIGQLAATLSAAAQSEDDMYYRLTPDAISYIYDTESQALQIQIGGNEAYPIQAFSSDPNDFIVRQIDEPNLLTLVSGKLLTIFTTAPDAEEIARSIFNSGGKPGARPFVTDQVLAPQLINSALSRAATALENVVLLNAPSDWTNNMTPGHHGLIVHAVFTHPDFNQPLHLHFFDETPFFVPNT